MNLIMYYSLFPLFLFIFFLFKLLFSSSKIQKSSPPSPPKLPVLGNLLQLGSHPHHSLHQLSKRYGPLMLLRFGSKPVLVASSADAARVIMKEQDIFFSGRPTPSLANRLLYGSKDIVFSSYSEYWRQLRSICVLHLLSNQRVHSFHSVREEETRLMVEKIRQSCDSPINLSDILMRFTSNIISRVTFGRKYSGKVQHGERDFESLVGELVEILATFDIGDYIPWLAWVNRINGLDCRVDKLAKELDEFLEGLVEEREHGKTKQTSCVDFVDIMLDIQKEKKDFHLHRDTIKALIVDMFTGGTHTTYTVLEWTMAELLKNPKTLEKLQNEVRTKFETNEDLQNMQYLKAVIKESLRLHAPVPLLVPRMTSQDVKVMGFHVAAGTKVFVNSWAIGRDPTVWENPEEFKPERFLESTVDYKGMHFELIPFGAGRRGCPGVAFAATVIELALATLLHEFDFTLWEEVLDMSEAKGMTVHKEVPLVVTATPRIV